MTVTVKTYNIKRHNVTYGVFLVCGLDYLVFIEGHKKFHDIMSQQQICRKILNS